MTFECTRVCGAGHNFMRGVLIVTEAAGARIGDEYERLT